MLNTLALARYLKQWIQLIQKLQSFTAEKMLLFINIANFEVN
jgi:hypothetical protein